MGGVRKVLAVVAGFALSVMLSIPLSFVGLIGTQGMHGTEPFLEIFAFVGAVLVVVNAIAAAVGMFPVALWVGGGPYRAAILGSCAGALIAAVLFTGSMQTPELGRISPRLCFVISGACAVVAILIRGE